MKKSAIKDIFYGFRGHVETMKMPKDENKSISICNIYEELKEKLTPELLALHQKLVDTLENNWSEEIDFYFTEGFKLGILIGIECNENNSN